MLYFLKKQLCVMDREEGCYLIDLEMGEKAVSQKYSVLFAKWIEKATRAPRYVANGDAPD